MRKLLKIIICRGLPASGKSIWSKELVKKDKTFVRINRDDFRHMLDGYSLDFAIEDLITVLEHNTIREALKGGWNVVVDNTHLREKYINAILKIAEEIGNISVEEKYFDISLEEALKRDAARPSPVGEDVIRKFHKKYIPGLKHLKPCYFEPLPKNHGDFVSVEGKDNIYLIDLDGTVARHVDRSPYDFDKVHLDEPIRPMIETAKALHKAGYKIVFMSGRDDACYNMSIDWIKKHVGFDDIELYMRKTGDQRKDSIVKRELYEQHIKDKYTVVGVFDDRPTVLQNCWRKIGLYTFDVGDGVHF